MTKNTSVTISHATKAYTLNVLECKPADAVCIIDADVEVDFAAPLDYVEPVRPAAAAASAAAAGAGPIVIDDDDDDSGAAAVAAASATFPGMAPLGAALRAGSAAAAAPAFIGGSGTTGGGPSAGSAAAPASGSSAATSLAAQAALKRAAAAAAAAAAGPPPSKFARKEPAVFVGAGHRVGDASSSTGAAGGAGGGAGAAIVSAGGIVVSTGAGDAARARTLNKFEQAKAAASFGGAGRSLRDEEERWCGAGGREVEGKMSFKRASRASASHDRRVRRQQ